MLAILYLTAVDWFEDIYVTCHYERDYEILAMKMELDIGGSNCLDPYPANKGRWTGARLSTAEWVAVKESVGKSF